MKKLKLKRLLMTVILIGKMLLNRLGRKWMAQSLVIIQFS